MWNHMKFWIKYMLKQNSKPWQFTYPAQLWVVHIIICTVVVCSQKKSQSVTIFVTKLTGIRSVSPLIVKVFSPAFFRNWTWNFSLTISCIRPRWVKHFFLLSSYFVTARSPIQVIRITLVSLTATPSVSSEFGVLSFVNT